jgi:hypothetical protein
MDGATKGLKMGQRRDNDETIKGRQTDDGWTETAYYRDDNDTTDVQRQDRERTVQGRRRNSDGTTGVCKCTSTGTTNERRRDDIKSTLDE